MSIKGIDTQIMMTRLTDNIREASVLQKRPEVAQAVLAAKGKTNDAEEQTRVVKMSETEMEKIRTDVDEDGGGGYGGEEESSPGEDVWYDEVDPDMIVPPGDYIIDITI